VVFQLIPNCSETPEPLDDGNGVLKTRIAEEKADKDSLKLRIVYRDRIQKEYVIQYRFIKGRIDSIPCEQALPQIISACDSVIAGDSTLIGELKAEIFVSDLIIANQATLIQKDSVQMASLNKKLRRQKRITKVVAGVGAVGWLIAVFK